MNPGPDFSDPSDSREYVETVLRRWGWECGPIFWDRYHRDAWVFNLVNALTRITAEVDSLRERVRVVAADPAPTDLTTLASALMAVDEARQRFYNAPDTEATVDASVPLVHAKDALVAAVRAVLVAADPAPTDPHTRTSTPHGPDFCAECSADIRQWVHWPCGGSARMAADPAPTGDQT